MWIDFLAPERKLEISSPFEFKHTVHVGFVAETGEFTVRLLQNSRYSSDA